MTTITNKKLLQLIKRHREITKLQAELDAEKKELTEQLKQEMRNRDLAELIIEGYKVNYCEYDVEIFDKKSFKEEHSKMYNQYIYIHSQTKLVVK